MERPSSYEDGLDEDFICYLEYAHKYADKLRERVHTELSKAWLNKLMEVPRSVPEKRNRNIFLSRLVLAMQTGELQKPFLKPPPSGPLPNAFQIFGPPQPEIEVPGGPEECDLNTAYISKDGRTYVATKSLGKGLGALTYMGVSVADVPEWEGHRPCDADDVFNAHFNAPKRAAFTMTSSRPCPRPQTQEQPKEEQPPQPKPSKDVACCCSSKPKPQPPAADKNSHQQHEEVMQLRGGANGPCQLYCDGQTEYWSDDTGDTMSVCDYYVSQMRNIDEYLGGKCCLSEEVEQMARDIQTDVTGQEKDYVDNTFVVELRDVLQHRFHSIQQQTERLNSLTEAAEQRLNVKVTSPEEYFQKVWSEAAADELLTDNIQQLEKIYTTEVRNKFLEIQKKLKMSMVEKGKESVKKEWMEMCNSHQQQIKRLEDKIKTAKDILETASKDLETICIGMRNAGKRESGDEKSQEERLMLQELSKLFNEHKAEQEEVDRLERMMLSQGGKLNKLIADERLLNESNCAIKSEIRKMVDVRKQ